MLVPGQLVAGKYRVERLLGEGGMGAVYVAVNQRLQKRVALKVLRPNTVGVAEAVARFAQEAIAASRVKHPGVVEIFDADVHEGMPWIAMELLEGESLGERMARERVSVAETLAIATDALSAIAAVHAAGIIHRDLKPDNLFIESLPGGRRRVKVLDFGIAKVSRDEISGLTGTGVAIGTPHYLAPEQASDAARVDARADVYAMGAILFEALSGAVPYEVDSFGELVMKMYTGGPRKVRELAPRVPAPIAELVDRCLSVDPAGRPPSAADLLREIGALRRSLSGSSRAGAPMAPAHRIPATQEAPAHAIAATRPAVPAAPRAPATPPVPAVPPVPAAVRVPAVPTRGPRARPAAATPVLAEPVSVPRPSPVGWVAAVVLLLAVGVGVGGWALLRGGASDGPAGASEAGATLPVAPSPEVPEEVAIPEPPVLDPPPTKGSAEPTDVGALLDRMLADQRRGRQNAAEDEELAQALLRERRSRSAASARENPAPPDPPQSDPSSSAASRATADREALRAALVVLRPRLQRCMAVAARGDPSSHDGQLVILIDVAPEGNVTGATLRGNTTGSADIARCALAAARRLRVRRPPGASRTTLSVPIRFQSPSPRR